MGKWLKALFLVLLFLIVFSFVFFRLQGQSLQSENQPQPSAAAFVSPAATVRENRRPVLHLAILADIHSDWKHLGEAVTEINTSVFDAVLVLGDITNLGYPEDLAKVKEELDKITVPVYVIPGNHDVWYAKTQKEAADAEFNSVFASLTPPGCVTLKDINLAFLNHADQNNEILQAEIDQITGCVSQGKPAYLFTHEPLYHPTNERVLGQYDSVLATQSAQLLNTLCTNKISAVIAAHLHTFTQYTYSCSDGYQMPMVISGAITGQRNFQPPRFTDMTVYDDGGFSDKEIVLN